jgi:hypothetical protein
MRPVKLYNITQNRRRYLTLANANREPCRRNFSPIDGLA